MDFGILHAGCQSSDYVFNGFPGTEFYGRRQLFFVCGIQLQLSLGHGFHIVDINGLSFPDNGSVAQSIHCCLVGTADLLQCAAAMAHSYGDSHLQHAFAFLTDIVQQVHHPCLGIAFINGNNQGNAFHGIENSKTAVRLQMVFCQVPYGNGNQFLMHGKHLLFRPFQLFHMNYRSQPFTRIQNVNPVFPQFRHDFCHIRSPPYQII